MASMSNGTGPAQTWCSWRRMVPRRFPHLAGGDGARTFAVPVLLDPDTVETLRALAQSYSSVTFETPDGIRLQLYGLGERVAALEAKLAGLIP
ncbi:MAG: hypothetical protein M5U01_22790 [Ardenticatenaceae bacterium]|nr:hypothetical protein [Ardenticatenaceae bacterium]